jgi:ABC-type multidrug transport system fused ATPase/permease subunit
MQRNETPPPVKLNWWNITRKYRKEQIFFYILTTISFLGSWFISQNAFKFVWDLIQKGTFHERNYKLEVFSSKTLYEFGSGREYMKPFLITMAIITFLYCLVVVAHVYFAYWLNNKIVRDTKKKILSKFFQLRHSHSEKEALSLIINDTRIFADYVLFAPNQLYYMTLETIFAFVGVYFASKYKYKGAAGGKALWLGIIYLLVVIILSLTLNFFFYFKDLLFQKQLAKQTKQENWLINQRDLVIKKNLVNPSTQAYQETLNHSKILADQEDFAFTLAYVVPSYSLIKYSKFFFFPFIDDKKTFIAFNVLTELFDAAKKMIERLKLYPYYFSAQKRLNHFLQLPERDDIQKNVLLSEPVKSLTLTKVSFSYVEGKPILKNTDWEFRTGKINHLRGENGFGKSTIVNLIMGIYQPQKGEILINQKYKLSEANLVKWREKIAYAEHENLIENSLSTGQKQLADLNHLFAQSKEKEIFIFDEADNALDEKNQQQFRQKIAQISRQKLVILISHTEF